MTDLSPVAASVSWSGKKDTGTAGGTVVRGNPLYRDVADGSQLKAADADAAASAVFAGFALNDAGDNQPVEYGYGDGTLTIGGTGVTIGQVYVISTTAGGIAPYSDLASGDFPTYLGVGASTSTIACQPHSPGVAKA
jgi:hypothetical protein